jgi:hypothetical protein
MNTCMGSLYLVFFIYLVMRNLLFYLALRLSKGEVKGILFITSAVDAIMLFMFPILLLMTGGVC